MEIITVSGIQSVEVSTTTTGTSGSNLVNPIDLGEIDTTNVGNGYIFAYNGTNQQYGFQDPDDLLKKAVEDGTLPQSFINKLDDELDNKIDADGGVF